jgi:hypothetical protein
MTSILSCSACGRKGVSEYKLWIGTRIKGLMKTSRKECDVLQGGLLVGRGHQGPRVGTFQAAAPRLVCQKPRRFDSRKIRRPLLHYQVVIGRMCPAPE